MLLPGIPLTCTFVSHPSPRVLSGDCGNGVLVMNTLTAAQSRMRCKTLAVIISILMLPLAACQQAAPMDREAACRMILDQDPTGEANPTVVITDLTASVASATSSAVFDEAISAASLEGRDYLVVAVDGGDARQVAQGRLSSDANERSATRKNESEAMPGCLRDLVLQTAAPTQPGSDLHSAFQLVTSVVPLDAGDVVVVSSDLLTNVGQWQLDAHSTASESPRDVAAAWLANAPIDMGGAALVWSGIADADEVPNNRIAWLRELASGLCEELNATGCDAITTPGSVGSRATDVPSGPHDPAIVWAEAAVEPDADLQTCTIDLPGALLFNSNSDVVTSAARAELERWVPVITSGERTIITGHTASPQDSTPEGLVEFSLRRATAVRDVLVELGVDPAKLEVRGAGDTDPVVEDRLPNGSLDESVAGANRRVEIRIERVTTCQA